MKNVRTFLAGALCSALIFALATPAGAALAAKTIKVYTGIDIYLDDAKFKPTDANGQPVEAIVYNGSTYLPLRAVAEAVGKPVYYDAATQSAYLGKHASNTPSVYLKDMDYFSVSTDTAGYRLKNPVDVTDNLGAAHHEAIVVGYNFDAVYKLNGQYSAFTGVLTRAQQDSASNNKGVFRVYGDGKLLYSSPEMTKDQEPVDFHVNLTGVLEMKIEYETSYYNMQNCYLCEAGLYT
ncbi:NPCBM/NEW2 domain-containing protein [Pseudoflavonifractor sp. HCP28S3_F10]|uniref:NPCBM/NEW2 domain-containing protein n=1 Tax=Pseudoflavonifractor sp. HCP28S3_F10 TaxID=3438947 RepID=UPI003F88C026